MKCKSCNSEIPENAVQCPTCFEEINYVDSGSSQGEDSKRNVVDKVVTFFQNKTVMFIALLVVAIASLGFTFGAISSTPETGVVYEDDEGSIVTYNFNQNSVQMYRGYINALTKDRMDVAAITEEQYEELTLDMEYFESARDYSRVYSRLDLYAYALLVIPNPDNLTFGYTLNFFMEILFLFTVQIIPLILIGYLIHSYVKKKDLLKSKNIFLLGGMFSILLSLARNNIFGKVSGIGYGLAVYMILMFATYFLLFIYDLYVLKKIDKRKLLFYGVRVAVAFVLVAMLSNSYIRFGSEFDEGKKVYSGYSIADSKSLYNTVSSDSEFIGSNVLTYASSRVLATFAGLENTYANNRFIISGYDLSLVMKMETMESQDNQTIYSLSLMIVSIITIALLLSTLYLAIIERDNKYFGHRIIMNIILSVLIAILLILSIVHIVQINQLGIEVNSTLRAYVSIGLIVSLLITVGTVMGELIMKKKLNVPIQIEE